MKEFFVRKKKLFFSSCIRLADRYDRKNQKFKAYLKAVIYIFKIRL